MFTLDRNAKIQETYTDGWSYDEKWHNGHYGAWGTVNYSAMTRMGKVHDRLKYQGDPAWPGWTIRWT